MKEKFLNSTINFINIDSKYSEEDIKKLRYGLEGLYLTITKMIFITLFAVILGIFREFFIILILFNILRFFGFGFHAEKSYQCLILSSIWFVILPYIIFKFTITTNLFLLISIFCIINILLFAPADTVKRPLYNKKKRKIRKFLNSCVAIFYIGMALFFNSNYINAIILTSLIIEVIVINPITYIILKQPYNNYKQGSF